MIKLIAALLLMAAHARADALLPVSEGRLRNGLAFVLAPDPSASAVVVHVRYAGGVGLERAAEAGYMHLVERLLVATSELEQRVDALGGWASSVTTRDHMSVFEQLPPEALELVLWFEANRMARLPEAIDAARLARARAEIAAEWRSAYVEQPSALVPRELQQQLWPAEHPNARLVLGDNRAVPRAVVENVREFARAHITADHATVVVAGRFDEARARRYIETYFGPLPKASVKPATVPGPLPPARRGGEHVVVDPIANVVIGFRSAAPPADDALAIDVIAQVLAGGRTSRLQRRLVDRKLASAVSTEIVRQSGGGELHVEATPLPGVDPARVASELRDEIMKLRAGMTADEVQRAAIAVDRDLVIALEGLAFRADALASWHAYTGSARMLDTLRARHRAITPSMLAGAAARWLAEDAAVTIIAKGAP